MSPSNHCRTSIFEEEFRFQSVRGDICIHIITQNLDYHLDIFVKVGLCLAMQIAKSVLTFGTETPFELVPCMHWESISNLKKVCSTVKLKLKNKIELVFSQ